MSNKILLDRCAQIKKYGQLSNSQECPWPFIELLHLPDDTPRGQKGPKEGAILELGD